MKIQNVIEEVAKVGRHHRSPKFPFLVRHSPWQIQPFAIAPVIPGETLKAAMLQVRAITDPIKNPLIGWWLEHYVFYVKLTDIEDAGLEAQGFFKSMLIDPAATLAAGSFYDAAASAWSYKAAIAGYDFVKACTACITKSYFRDDDENWALNALDGVPLARAVMPGRENWSQSLMKDDTETDPKTLTGASPDDPDVAAAYQEAYDRMLMMGATTLTYEDWLKSFGIRGVTVKRPGRPELLRYGRAWQYPSSHVDAASGAVSSVVSWAQELKADKARFFKEPGFVVGVTCARPKVYLNKQVQNATLLMDNAFSWLPATLRDRPELGLRKLAAGSGPLGANAVTNAYWVDLRDLVMYGDQFTNVDLAATDAGMVALPDVNAGLYDKVHMLYVTGTMIEGLFTSANAAGVRAGRQVRQDGTLDLHILTAESDPTR